MHTVGQGVAVFVLMCVVGVLVGISARLTVHTLTGPTAFRYAAWAILGGSGVVYLAYEVTTARHSWLGIGAAVFALCASACDVVIWRRTRR